MDIHDIYNFRIIAEEGSITGAANRLHIAQPPLSRQMKQLEAELGVQLFERGSRRIRLTEAGQLLRARADEILALIDSTIKDLAELHTGVAGTLMIGTVTTSGAILLPTWVKAFHTRYPEVTFQLWEGDSFRILELLDKGVIEVGIVRLPLAIASYDSIALPAEPLVVAMSKYGQQCGIDPAVVRLKELDGLPLIIPRDGWETVFKSHCEQTGVKFREMCKSDGIFHDLLWANSGIGMALVPQSAISLIPNSNLIGKTIIEPTLYTQTAVIWSRSRRLSGAARHFLDLLHETVAK